MLLFVLTNQCQSCRLTCSPRYRTLSRRLASISPWSSCLDTSLPCDLFRHTPSTFQKTYCFSLPDSWFGDSVLPLNCFLNAAKATSSFLALSFFTILSYLLLSVSQTSSTFNWIESFFSFLSNSLTATSYSDIEIVRPNFFGCFLELVLPYAPWGGAG